MSCETYSLVSRVMMIRMGLLFMPPTQLLLHMKLYRMVVNSVPTYNARERQHGVSNSKSPPDGSVCASIDVMYSNELNLPPWI